MEASYSEVIFNVHPEFGPIDIVGPLGKISQRDWIEIADAAITQAKKFYDEAD
jgi:hypothetical protein